MTMLSILLALAPAVAPNPAEAGRIQFNRDIRPILSDKCFFCHGPDKAQRKADLRLDTREGLLGRSGEPGTVVSGKPAESELFQRIIRTDDYKRMPPPKAGKDLTESEKATIRKWIEQGASYEGHWSFQPVAKSGVNDAGAIDTLITAELARRGLAPVAEADRRTLLRRLSFDLTGLPPTPQEVDAFINDKDPGAYARQVERLLASPAMAKGWRCGGSIWCATPTASVTTATSP